MKRILVLILAVAMCCVMCACGNNAEAVEKEINETVTEYAVLYCMTNYANVRTAAPEYPMDIRDEGDGTYTIAGELMVVDNNGEHYYGDFGAVVSIDSSGEGTCTAFSLATPEK